MRYTIELDINGLIIGYPPTQDDNQAYTEGEINAFMKMKFPHFINGEILEQPEEGYFYIDGEWVDKAGFMPDYNGGFIAIPVTQVILWTQPSTSEEHEIPLGIADINAASTRMTTTFAAMPDADQPYTFSNGVTINFNKADWDDLVQKVHTLLNP